MNELKWANRRWLRFGKGKDSPWSEYVWLGIGRLDINITWWTPPKKRS